MQKGLLSLRQEATLAENQEFDPKAIAAFKKWKEKRKWPEFYLDRETNIRLFREKYGVEHGSNYHCPWCYEGRLFHNQDQDFYVCRRCELKFKIECLDPEMFEHLLVTKKEERKQRRLQKRAQESHSGDVPQEVMDALETQEDPYPKGILDTDD